MRSSRKNFRAFTVVQVLVILVVLFLLGLVFLSAASRTRTRVARIDCEGNLKQVGLACQIGESDGADRFPFGVSINNGGGSEAFSTGSIAKIFQVMSNELETPKVLICPADRKRNAATGFLSLRKTNISYFLGLDTMGGFPDSIVSGDHNITNMSGLNGGILLALTNDPAEWTDGLHNGSGNIGLQDGSVRYFSTAQLRQAIANTGFQTNRFLMP